MLISCVHYPRTDVLQVKETLPVYIPSSWCLASEGMPTGWRLFLVTIDQTRTISRIVDTQPHLLYQFRSPAIIRRYYNYPPTH